MAGVYSAWLIRRQVMHWGKELAYLITPKHGPLRSLDTLLQAKQAILEDLPKGYMKRPHWRAAGWAILRAADSGTDEEIKRASDVLLQAATAEGWMTRRKPEPEPVAPAQVQSRLLDECMFALRTELQREKQVEALTRLSQDLGRALKGLTLTRAA